LISDLGGRISDLKLDYQGVMFCNLLFSISHFIPFIIVNLDTVSKSVSEPIKKHSLKILLVL